MGNDAMQAKLMQEAMRNQDFRYGIEKNSQGLRKFRNGSENFTMVAKISQW